MSSRFEKHIQGLKQFLKAGLTDGSVSITSVDASTFFIFNVLHWIPKWLDAIHERRHDEAIDGLIECRYSIIAVKFGRLSGNL